MIMQRALPFVLLAASAQAGIVADVRAAIAKNDLPLAEATVQKLRQQSGITPELLEAHSWLGRGALAAKQFDQADRYAAETRKLALAELGKRNLDEERHLPIALGASIEVQAQVAAAKGERDQAVAFLEKELARYRTTSIRTRIQKNINLLSLEGKNAPPLGFDEWLGEKPRPLAQLKGKPVLLFLWAHWCGDCKQQGPVLAKLQQEYGTDRLAIIGPTQRYGYAEGGRDVSPAEELPYIDRVRKEFYGALGNMPVPVSEETFKNYGASTTPTLVLIDRNSVVKMYHPGKMTYEDLKARIDQLLGS